MVQTSIKVFDDLYERATEWCKQNDRSFGYLVRIALEQFLSSSNSDPK